MTAENLMCVSGIGALFVTLILVRQRTMREKYAMLWLAMAGCLLFLGFFPSPLKWFAHTFRLAYPTAVLFGALTMIYLFSLGVSISISHHHRNITALLQDLAILKMRVADLERQINAKQNPS